MALKLGIKMRTAEGEPDVRNYLLHHGYTTPMAQALIDQALAGKKRLVLLLQDGQRLELSADALAFADTIGILEITPSIDNGEGEE